MKIKSNHPFTKAQLVTLNKELNKISKATVVPAMRGTTLPALNDNFLDIQVLHTAYGLEIYLSFIDVTNSDYPKSNLYQIDAKGNLDKDIRKTLEFDSLADRVNYFSNLEPINFKF